MKKILPLLLIILLTTALSAQVTCLNDIASDTTHYTNGAPNDSLFFICAGQTANLLATPPSGSAPWDFVWESFSVANNNWNAQATQMNVLTSTQNTLQPGGYRCTITDGGNVVVGTYIVWVCRIDGVPNVNVNPISPGCTTVNLVGQITNANITPYYNPPTGIIDPNSALIVNANTVITVCFSGTHTYVSDLAFHLRGPASCGSPDILLAPSPGVCNAGDNINNLCFSTTASPSFNVCTAGAPLTGTYDSYGATATSINWAPLYGCDASQPGWAVQIYDCVGLDFGSLTDATLTFSGNSVGGDPITYTYTTPAGFNSPIADNSCSAAAASIFTVPAPGAVPINFTYTYIWTADPPFEIPSNTSLLNITLNPGPAVDTEFTLTLTGTNPGNVCGGTSSDTEAYDYQPGAIAIINQPNTEFCISDSPFNLTTNFAGGTWSGTGITNAAAGTFNPAVAGQGNHVITYTPASSCNSGASITLNVSIGGTTTIAPTGILCVGGDVVQLQAGIPGGVWSGPGIVNASTGTFDPSVAGAGVHTINYIYQAVCAYTATTNITVQGAENISIDNPGLICYNHPPIQLTTNASGGTWSGDGGIDANGVFNPAIAGLGNNTVYYTITGNCASSDTLVIFVSPNPFVNAGLDQEICANTNVSLAANGATEYTWSPTTALSSATIANPIASPNSTITYTVTGTDAVGCQSTDQITIVVNANPVVTASVLGNNTICNGESVQLDANGSLSYVWTPVNSLSEANAESPFATPTTTTVYTVSGTDINGCSDSTQVTVNVVLVIASFTATPETGLSPLEVEFTNQSTGSFFDWDFGNGNTLNNVTIEVSPVQTYIGTIEYNITLIAYEGNCSDTLTETVFSYYYSEITKIPNVITPNGKNGNDTFRILSSNLRKIEVLIYNRWGKEIGKITRPEGEWKPDDFAGGTYFYTLKAEGYDSKKYDLQGSFTILSD
jgi:gliding motility-associated-like protein